MTVAELAGELEERGVTVTVFGETGWVVWVQASDDPTLGAFVGEHVELEIAIRKALLAWDRGGSRTQPPPPSGEH